MRPKFGNFVIKAAVLPEAPKEISAETLEVKAVTKKESKKDSVSMSPQGGQAGPGWRSVLQVEMGFQFCGRSWMMLLFNGWRLLEVEPRFGQRNPLFPADLVSLSF